MKNNKFIDKLKYYKGVLIHKTRLFFVSFKQDGFKIFLLIYSIISLCLIAFSMNNNYFDLLGIDMGNFFLTSGSMLGTILALCITIHIFYVQSFLNYSTLTFIYDINKDKKNYRILGCVGFFSLFFFFLGGNFNKILNHCPDRFLFPISLFLIAISILLVIFYFYDITRRLSPKSLCEDTENYFYKTLSSLKKYEKIGKDYELNIKKIGWYKLESMCDNYLKLIDKRENRLASDYLGSIEKCFGYLIKSYDAIKSGIELKYLTNTTEIDSNLNKLFDRIEGIIILNIKSNDIELIGQSIRLCLSIILNTYEINYELQNGKVKKEKILFYNSIHRWNKIFEDIVKYNNEEAFFQWKEGTKSIISVAISNISDDYTVIYRIESMLKNVNTLNVILNNNQRGFFNLHEIYSLLYLSILNNKINDERIMERANRLLYNFFGNNGNNIDDFIKNIQSTISANLRFLVEMTKKDTNYIKNMLHFMDVILDIIKYISKIEGLNIGNRLGLLIENLGIYLYNVNMIRLIDKIYITQGMNKIVDIINCIINSKNKIFCENVMSEKNVYDQLCWIGIYAMKEHDSELFNKCFDTFSNHILLFCWNNYNLGEIKYFCYRLFTDDEKNYKKYFDILHRFFKIKLSKYPEEIKSHGKAEIIKIINQINGCFSLDERFLDIGISEIMLKDEDGVKPENQESITQLILSYCRDILNLKKKKK